MNVGGERTREGRAEKELAANKTGVIHEKKGK